MLARAHFRKAPPIRKIIPSWSLEDALSILERKTIDENDTRSILCKTIFLVAAASSNRAAELAAIDRAAISFRQGCVKLGVHAGFIFKNQALGHAPSDIIIPELGESNLCPVSAIKSYLEKTRDSRESALFLSPVSGKPLNSGGVSYWLAKAIDWLVVGSKGKAHDIRKLSTSLAWYRGVSTKDVIATGSWTSMNTFIRRYLTPSRPKGFAVVGRSIC